jgi:Bacteriophage probable baseplate hub protein
MGGARNFEIMLDGDHIPDDHFLSFSIDRDMYQADMAAIVLSNQGHVYSTKKIGAAIEVKIGDPAETIYKGEIVGLEPTFRGKNKTEIVLRCMNKLHRLLRKRKSVTFTDKSDQQILNQVCGDVGLSLEWKHEKSITYKHVYQHNQTDLEFLRQRASRMGCFVWCVDQKVFVKQPELDKTSDPKLTMEPDKDGAGLRSFTPRMSSALVVNKVTVKGWNPETKELIVGTASVSGSKLGDKTAVSGSGPFGNEETFNVDTPVWSADEANALAKARLTDLNLTYITGEAETMASSKFDLGNVIEIAVSNKGSDDPFNGKYVIMGMTHRHSAAAKDGMTTILRLARDAQHG